MLAERADGTHVVTDKKHRAPVLRGDLAHFAEAFFLEARVADREDFINEQDLRFEVRGHGEGEADEHAARIVFHRRVYELLDLGERDDLVELRADFPALHPEDGAIEEDVFAACEIGVKAGADFEQRGETTAEDRATAGRLGDARKDFQQRAFARAVAPDDADDFAGLRGKADVADGPESVGLGAFPSQRCSGRFLVWRAIFSAAAEARGDALQRVTQAGRADAAEAVQLGKGFDFDARLHDARTCFLTAPSQGRNHISEGCRIASKTRRNNREARDFSNGECKARRTR